MNTNLKQNEARPTQPLSVQRWLKKLLGGTAPILLGTAGLALSSMPAQAAFLRSVQEHQLDIKFIFSEETTQQQREAFELAGLFWSNFLDDDVTLTFYVDMTNDFLPENVLGGSLPGMKAGNLYNTFRNEYQGDITSSYDQTAYNNMDVDWNYDVVTQGSSGTRNRSKFFIDTTRAAAKAVGLLDQNNPNWDGYITMNSNFNWSYDLLNGPGNNEVDFFSVAIHELGHQLGFTSVVDQIVADLLSGGSSSSSGSSSSASASASASSNGGSASGSASASSSNSNGNVSSSASTSTSASGDGTSSASASSSATSGSDSSSSSSDSCATGDDTTPFNMLEEGEINCIEVEDIGSTDIGLFRNAQVLDLFRYSQEHGNTIDVTLNGDEKYFSLDRQNAVATDGSRVYDHLADCQANSSNSSECRTANFSKGLLIVDQNGNSIGDGYQGSHWKQRLQLGTSNAIGIMDPAIGYGTTREITGLDLLAFDVVGWDLADGLEEMIETGQLIFDRQALVTELWAEAQQQAANAQTMTRADADPIIQTMLPDSQVYNSCWLFPWLPGCDGGGWQTFLAQNLLPQEVIAAESEKVPEPTATVGLFSLGLLGLISGWKRRRPK